MASRTEQKKSDWMLDQIQAYYQPQYDALSDTLVGAEALARWVQPDGTVLYPDRFIPQLEATGQVVDLDWEIYRQTCAFLGKRLTEGRPVVPISVNFSRCHAWEQDMVDHLCRTAAEYGVDHSLLVVELTESAFIADREQIASMVAGIRKAGFQVAIDDFGSGLSSLSLLKDIPADILKLDRALLSCNCADERERIVLESILNVAQRLKFCTVAEGVETREQLGFLRTGGCQTVQGFLYSQAIPSGDFANLLAIQREPILPPEDILCLQAPTTAVNLLLEAVFTRFPLVILGNLSRNSYYMMAYENFTTTSCAASGAISRLVQGSAETIHPEDRTAFVETFSVPNQLLAHGRGETTLQLTFRQRGDDGVYRRIETTNYFVHHPTSSDVLFISMSQPL